MIQLSAADIVLLVVVIWMFTLGLGALAIGVTRPPVTRRMVVLFGLFSAVYGLRLLVTLPLVSPPTGLPRYLVSEGPLTLTSLVLLPLILLVEQFVGRGWHSTMRATVWTQIAYSTIGVLTLGVPQLRSAFLSAKPYIVLVIGASALGNIFFASRQLRDVSKVLAFGFVVFLATVGVFNVGLIVHRPALVWFEVLGYVVLAGCLAYAVALYGLQTEARLLSIDREVRSAQQIQASILPLDLPSATGVSIGARYRPMTTMAGDFYDVIRIDDQTIGVLVADVLGHGLAASLIAAMVKVAFNAEAAHADDPGAVLTGMNTTLVRLLDKVREYVTASYVVINTAAHTLTYARAGHPPALLVGPDGAIRELDDGGTILGLFPDAAYPRTSVSVPLGSRALLYTDGVTEAMNPSGEFFGLDRLKAQLVSHSGLDADQSAGRILNAILEWQGRAMPGDDVTIIVVDVVPSPLPQPVPERKPELVGSAISP